MHLGLAVPQYGAFARPDAIRRVARAAEEMGFHSLWVGDRILTPVRPRDRYPSRDGGMPEQYRTFLDPLTVLTVAAEATERVRLGTSTLNALWYPPVVMARTLTTLDLVSGGRLDVGIGLGWARDEYQAAGVPWEGRGRRLEEWLDVVEAVWAGNPVAHEGPHYAVPESHIAPKPVQRPHPPLLLAGFSPRSLARVGRRADGWLPVAMPLPALARAWRAIQEAAEAAGRDPARLRRPLRINATLVSEPTDGGRPGHGTVAQLADYVLAAAAEGVSEVFVDLQQTTTEVDEMLEHAAALAARVGVSA